MSDKFHRKKYLLHIPVFKILSDELYYIINDLT